MSQDLKQDQVPKQMTQATGPPTPAPALAIEKQDLKQDQVPKQMTQATGPPTSATAIATAATVTTFSIRCMTLVAFVQQVQPEEYYIYLYI